ncbi:MAG TPA: MFS transporter [Gemmataceae bacterium]|nr:MFS transporter [Gemmataceae bacterium]
MTVDPLPRRRSWWKWTVCGLLLLATMINYMDRIALNQTSERVMTDLKIEEKGYGNLESWFGVAFALGAIVSGFAADRIAIRWLYAGMVVAWSAAGAATLLVHSYEDLLICRVLLGFCEAANWPCAVRTTQCILSREERTLGNSILQSGAAFGSIFTPTLVWLTLNHSEGLRMPWRLPFGVIGVFGCVWAIAWIVVLRRSELAQSHHRWSKPSVATKSDDGEKTSAPVWPRFLALAIMVVLINATWHFFRVWLPPFLQGGRGYSEEFVFSFSTGYYVAAGIGSILAGILTSRLIALRVPVHRSRVCVFFFFALLCLLSIPAAFLDRGVLLVAVLLVLGCAALGIFPNYYTFTQELSVKHQGKVTGALGFICWAGIFVLHKFVGWSVQTSKARYFQEAIAQGLNEHDAKLQALSLAYQPVVALIGLAPLLGLLAVVLLWNVGQRKAAQPRAPAEQVPEGNPGVARAQVTR